LGFNSIVAEIVPDATGVDDVAVLSADVQSGAVPFKRSLPSASFTGLAYSVYWAVDCARCAVSVVCLL
jgi:hypothetical protein